MQADLITEISETIGKTKVAKLSRILTAKNFELKELVDLTFYPDNGISFRASWLLENMLLEDPSTFVSSVPYIITKIKKVTNPSCKRHYAKILMHLTSPTAPGDIRAAVKDINLEPAVEQCFDWMIDPNVLVAVKSFAAEALFNMRHRYPWISAELQSQLEFLMRDGTAAIQSKGKRLLSYLQPEGVHS